MELDWFDADTEIERLAGKSIREIFRDDGEPKFRDWESSVVDQLTGMGPAVVALGGGAVVRQQNRQALADCTVIWLTADADTIFARISTDTSTQRRRPNLTSVGGRDEIVQLLSQRQPIYRACADYTVDTVGKSPEQLADEIVCLLAKEE